MPESCMIASRGHCCAKGRARGTASGTWTAPRSPRASPRACAPSPPRRRLRAACGPLRGRREQLAPVCMKIVCRDVPQLYFLRLLSIPCNAYKFHVCTSGRIWQCSGFPKVLVPALPVVAALDELPRRRLSRGRAGRGYS